MSGILLVTPYHISSLQSLLFLLPSLVSSPLFITPLPSLPFSPWNQGGEGCGWTPSGGEDDRWVGRGEFNHQQGWRITAGRGRANLTLGRRGGFQQVLNLKIIFYDAFWKGWRVTRNVDDAGENVKKTLRWRVDKTTWAAMRDDVATKIWCLSSFVWIVVLLAMSPELATCLNNIFYVVRIIVRVVYSSFFVSTNQFVGLKPAFSRPRSEKLDSGPNQNLRDKTLFVCRWRYLWTLERAVGRRRPSSRSSTWWWPQPAPRYR